MRGQDLIEVLAKEWDLYFIQITEKREYFPQTNLLRAKILKKLPHRFIGDIYIFARQ